MPVICKVMGWGLLALACGWGASCRPVADAWMTGWTSARANDRIMVVRAEPRSLGYQRMVSQAGVYPDLAVFLNRRGMPDCVAESTNADRHLLILYYLETRTAYACRALAPSSRQIEFAGPYSITGREYDVLSGLRDGTLPATEAE